MVAAAKGVVYKAFGLKVSSPIPLPELPQTNGQENDIDVEIEIADLSGLWRELVPPQKKSVVMKDLYMFQIPSIARFCIENGSRIIVSPFGALNPNDIRLFILGTCMGAVLLQRKVLPLHGSALVIDGKAYCIIGDSGAGKSTLASVFLSKGYRLLTDDIIAVSLSSDNTPLVSPSYPQQKLWRESLKELGMKADGYHSVFKRDNKYAVPVLSKFSSEPISLAGVCELVKTGDDQIGIQKVERLERLHTLFRHTYRNFLLAGLGLIDWHFRTSAGIVNQIDFFRLSRPVSGFSAPNLASLLLTTIKEEIKL